MFISPLKKSFLFKFYHSSSVWWMSELSAVKVVMSSMKELPDWLIAMWVCMTRKIQFSLQCWHELSIAISVSPQSLFVTDLCQCLQTWTYCHRLMPAEPASYRFQEKQFKHFQEPLKKKKNERLGKIKFNKAFPRTKHRWSKSSTIERARHEH